MFGIFFIPVIIGIIELVIYACVISKRKEKIKASLNDEVKIDNEIRIEINKLGFAVISFLIAVAMGMAFVYDIILFLIIKNSKEIKNKEEVKKEKTEVSYKIEDVKDDAEEAEIFSENDNPIKFK